MTKYTINNQTYDKAHNHVGPFIEGGELNYVGEFTMKNRVLQNGIIRA